MLNPCNTKVWVVVELCDSVEPSEIGIANYELFSSTPKDFSIYASADYPTNDWQLGGEFTATDSRSLQLFPLSLNGNAKYIKFELHSHYGTQHYCPISSLKVYGNSMVDQYHKNNLKDESGLDRSPESLDSSVIAGVSSNQNIPDTPPQTEQTGTGGNAILRQVKEMFSGLLPSRKNTHDEKNVSSVEYIQVSDILRNLSHKYKSKTPALINYFRLLSNAENGVADRFCNANKNMTAIVRPTTERPKQHTETKPDQQNVHLNQQAPPTTQKPQSTIKPPSQNTKPGTGNQTGTGEGQLKPSIFVELSNKVKALENSLRLQREDFQNKLNETRSKLDELEGKIQDLHSYAYAFGALFVAYLTYRFILDLI